MSSGLLPDHIEPLVDRLRAGDHLPIALPDVAAVTEVLMRSLESYFKSIDLTLYKECQDLADYIEDARSEISSLSPEHDDSAGIPRAGQELDAIVEATESATDTIMQAAEDLMSFDSEDFDEYKNHINTEVMKIFEACSFQDITGQRISKVVKTLNHVEDRVGKLIAILGINSQTAATEDAKPILDPSSTDEIDEDDLLSGPALAGEGIDQGEVDSLLDDQMGNPNEPEEQLNATSDVNDASSNMNETNSPDEAADVDAVDIEMTEDVTEENIEEPISEEIAMDVSDLPDAPDAEIEVETVEVEAGEAVDVENVEQAQDDVVVNTQEPSTEDEPKKPKASDAMSKAANEETSQDDIDSLFA